MTTTRMALLAVTMAVFTGGSLAAQAPLTMVARGNGPPLLPRPAAPSGPYAKLFEPKELASGRQAVDATPAAETKPRVVCGMTLIPADPNFDSAIRVQPGPRQDVRHTMRTIPPPACR
jgi:hypothetical protein